MRETPSQFASRLVNEWNNAPARFGVRLARAVEKRDDEIFCPDFETAIRMVGAQMHHRGKFYIEIAVDPKTKEVAWTFEPTLPDA